MITPRPNVRSIQAELLVDVSTTLAEGPYWDHTSGELWFVDIPVGALYTFETATGALRREYLGSVVTAVVGSDLGGQVLVLDHGIARRDAPGDELRMVIPLEKATATSRFNDAACDPSGRLWAGTLVDDPAKERGSLYSIEPDGMVPVLEGIEVSNGIGWSPDGSTMYYVDSPTLRIDRLDYDLANGSATNRRPFVEIEPGAGEPDGIAVDADGGVWVALFEGAEVRRYSADAQLTTVVEVPTRQVTSCCFGGSDLTDLYITTAAWELDPLRRQKEPLAGAVFVARTDVVGLPATRCAW